MRKPKEIFFFLETFAYYKQLLKYNASVHTDDDLQKMQFTILRENHVIEKGMSMRSPRKGFGQEKITNLINRLCKYYNLYHSVDLNFLIYPLSTIKSYILYSHENEIQIFDIENRFLQLLEKTKLEIELKDECGIKLIKKEEIYKTLPQNFSDFVNSRHSIRYFSKETPDLLTIKNALEIAQQTPSACNRQGWIAHIFYGSKNQELLQWQNGAKNFENEVPFSILITANMKAFLYYEPFQLYVDGGLYAMSLIYALHSLKLGTIPLSCGFDHKKLAKLKTNFEIPENEVPIIIIGVGCLLDEFNVAISTRKDINLTTVTHC